MAGVNLNLPQFGAGNGNAEYERRQIRSYLFQLTEQLQYALNNLDIDNFSEQGKAEVWQSGETSVKISQLTEEQASSFNKLRDEIIKTATEIRNEYKTDIEKTDYSIRSEAAEMYVARSDGDPTGTVSELKEYIQSSVDQTAREVRMEFSETAEIAQETADGLAEYKRDISTYIKFYADGIEIGKTQDDESLPYSVKITNEKMSFLQNGVEVAYIMYNKLYITAVEILDRLSIGSASMGGCFDFETSETGLGIIWRDQF